VWSVHVDTAVDPSHTDVITTTTTVLPDGKRSGTVAVIPRDRFGSHLGPGRASDLAIGGGPATTVTGPIEDNGDGSYTVPVAWDPAMLGRPSITIGQPDRIPAVITDLGIAAGACRRWRLLFWLLLLIALLLLILLPIVWSS
jgi:hypothetical protein